MEINGIYSDKDVIIGGYKEDGLYISQYYSDPTVQFNDDMHEVYISILQNNSLYGYFCFTTPTNIIKTKIENCLSNSHKDVTI